MADGIFLRVDSALDSFILKEAEWFDRVNRHLVGFANSERPAMLAENIFDLDRAKLFWQKPTGRFARLEWAGVCCGRRVVPRAEAEGPLETGVDDVVESELHLVDGAG